MREAFNDQLDRTIGDLVSITRRVETAVAGATRALMEADPEAAESVISGDAAIDLARERVEDSCFSLLMLQQPVASDLRTVVAALRMVSELERMGDLAVHVAKVARMRVPERAVPAEVRPTVEQMAAVALEMVHRVVDIIDRRDVEAALDLAAADEEMDKLRRASFRDILGEGWTHGVEAAVDLALLGRYYERIADHAVSVANRVVFVATGEFPVEVG